MARPIPCAGAGDDGNAAVETHAVALLAYSLRDVGEHRRLAAACQPALRAYSSDSLTLACTGSRMMSVHLALEVRSDAPGYFSLAARLSPVDGVSTGRAVPHDEAR